MAGCGKDAPAPDPSECWGRQLAGKQAGGNLMFCVSGSDARQTTSLPGRDKKLTTCKASGKVVSRSKEKLSISLDAGSCDNGRSSAAHRMSCLSAEGRSWACEFSKEAKLPAQVFFPVARSD